MKALRLLSFALIGILISGGQALAVAGHGPVIITGTYASISARPDPCYGRIIQVTGGVKGSGINLRIGNISLPNGTIEKDGTIQGTANWNGNLYNFMAKPRPQTAAKPTPH